jgi:sterol 14alpha-demethylase
MTFHLIVAFIFDLIFIVLQTGGWPIIGHFGEFSANPVETIKAGYKANGSVFTMNFLHQPLTFLIGPDAQAPFYRANDEELSQNEPYKFMTPIFGNGIVFDAPIHIKNQQLRFVSSALKTSALKTYVPQIVKEVEQYLESWGESGTIDLLDAMANLTILTASRCLLGKEVRENLFKEVSELLHDIDEGLQPIAIFFPYLPIPAFRKRDRARAELTRIFSKVIAARRNATGEKPEDMLQGFIDAEYKDGSKCDDYQITGLLLGVLFAGQHTSSITSTSTQRSTAPS